LLFDFQVLIFENGTVELHQIDDKVIDRSEKEAEKLLGLIERM